MNDSKLTYHVPVLLKESIEALNIKPGGTYVDVTMGGGGHSRALLERLGREGHLYGFDQDADAVANAPQDTRFTFVRSNFRFLKNWLNYYNALPVDGLLADLGVSSHHFDSAERGFSLRQKGPLDMRMNQTGDLTAADVVNNYDRSQLSEIFMKYGELYGIQNALANAIVKEREKRPFVTTEDLIEATAPVLDKSREKKDLAKMFQALRIEVNHEMDALTQMLYAGIEALRPGGRLVVLSYHSLEDRLVKNFMRSGNDTGAVQKDFYGNSVSPMKIIKGFDQKPTQEEQELNPRSRSANLRIAERTDSPAYEWNGVKRPIA